MLTMQPRRFLRYNSVSKRLKSCANLHRLAMASFTAMCVSLLTWEFTALLLLLQPLPGIRTAAIRLVTNNDNDNDRLRRPISTRKQGYICWYMCKFIPTSGKKFDTSQYKSTLLKISKRTTTTTHPPISTLPPGATTSTSTDFHAFSTASQGYRR